MSSRVCKIPFQGTENQERELRALIQRLREIGKGEIDDAKNY